MNLSITDILGAVLAPGVDLKALGADQAETLLRDKLKSRFLNELRKVRRQMKDAGLTPKGANRKELCRDAQFRLWRAVIGQGDIADVFRDRHHASVWGLVEPRIAGVADLNLDTFLNAVVEAEVAVTF